MLYCPTYVVEPPDYLIDVRRRVFVQLLIVTKDDDGDIDGAEDGELVRLLEEAAFALEEGDAAVAIVADCGRNNVSWWCCAMAVETTCVATNILGLISILRLPMISDVLARAVWQR